MATEKTIREWFEELPEPQRTEAIDNTDEAELDELTSCLSDALAWAFVWEKTPQGQEYWSDIYREQMAKEDSDEAI